MQRVWSVPVHAMLCAYVTPVPHTMPGRRAAFAVRAGDEILLYLFFAPVALAGHPACSGSLSGYNCFSGQNPHKVPGTASLFPGRSEGCRFDWRMRISRPLCLRSI